MRTLLLSAAVSFTLTVSSALAAEVTAYTARDGVRFQVAAVAEFDQPWAMTFLPDGRL